MEYLLLTLRFDCPRLEAERHCDDCLDQVVDPFQGNLEPALKSRLIERMEYAFVGNA